MTSGGGLQESISSDSPLVILLTALLSGGVGTGLTAVWRARKTVPAERDNLIVGSAQTALLSMKDSLAAESTRADRAEKALRDRDRQIATKDARIEALERSLDAMQDRLAGQMEQLEKLRLELHEIRTAT